MNQTAPSRALVRPPSPSFIHAISTSGLPIDLFLAGKQHAEYCQALESAGLVVEALPPDVRYPDSCFMQDPALIVRGQGVVCRMGAASRQGEEAAVAQALADRGVPLAQISSPGTLEGGDVLVLPDRVLVGLTLRSNPHGIAQLAQILEPLGMPVSGIPVSGYLHLLSAVTYIGHETLLAVDEYASHPAFAGMNVIRASPEDAYAVNALASRTSVVLPAGYPRVANALEAVGFAVLPVPMTEFAKADGGVTCLSLVW